MNKTQLEAWIEKWGINLDWEAREKLREAVREMHDQSLGQLPYSPFCNCKQVENLLQKAVQELPDGNTVDQLQQVIFEYCPVCGKKFADEG